MPIACEVLVIGGGPAGSTAAALLAGRGVDVVLLEKEQHPRFHIGESLLPANMPLLRRLGVEQAVIAAGTFKPGAEFVDDDTGHRSVFRFDQSLNVDEPAAYQVPRAAFDAILFRAAAAHGARTAERTRVTAVSLAPPGGRASVVAEQDGAAITYQPRFVLDATGRDTLMGSQFGLKQANKHNSTAAVYAHWRGVRMQLGERPGFITVHLASDGWFWMIPLPDDVMSVGFVGNAEVFKNRSGTAQELYLQRLSQAPTVAARMRGAERLGAITSTGNYSYRCTPSHGAGWMAIGDACAFLDPVFSSGVLLAMTGAELGAGVAQAALQDAALGEAKARRAEAQIRTAMENLGWLVYRINSPVLRSMFMRPSNRFRMRDGLIALLAGNLRIGRQLRGPVLAFKAAYYLLAGLRKLGYTPPPVAAEPLALPAE